MSTTGADRTGIQRRTVRVLVASQVLGGVGVGAGVAVVSLLAFDLAGTAALSGVPATASTIGAAAAAVVIAGLSVRAGRRPGLVTGYLVGAAGAATAIVAALQGAFLLHVVASFLIGWASAANLQARYAATDLAAPDRRAGALSTVVWATTVGAVLGPNLVGPGEAVAALLSWPPLAGAYLFSVVSFLGAALVQLVGLRPDPLVLVRADTPVSETSRDDGRLGLALTTIRRSPAALAALLAIAAAHATMIGVMVMTPVHMEGHGAGLRLVGITISLHIAGMYALSPAVGALADRLGRVPVLWLGLGQLALAGVLAGSVAAMGDPLFQLGLVLLGTGWSFALVAGSTLLTDAVPAPRRPAVQGASDLVMNLAGGVGGTLAGVVLALATFPALAYGSVLLLVAPAVALVRAARLGLAEPMDAPDPTVVAPAPLAGEVPRGRRRRRRRAPR
ncbi:MAG: MFS transporter [Nitriliruptoraceae bacterium]|nr:MFS transporter [Nitriliruptoraceae bacterium]